MRGTIRRRHLKDGTVRYDARYRAAGRQVEKTFRRKRDAEAFLDKASAAVRDGSYMEVRPSLMRDVFSAWGEDLETRVKLGEVRASTASTYRCNLAVHIEPVLCDYRSDRLTARAMAKWRAGLASKVDGGEMSPKSFNNVFTLARQILTWARHPAQGHLAHDPLVGQKRLRLKPKEAEYLEDDDMTALLKAAADQPEANAVIHLGLFAGLRRSEIFGLQWGDIADGEAELGGRIRVRRAAVDREITPPKTDNRNRVVDVPQRVLDVLATHRATCPPMGAGFIFRTRTSMPVDPGSWYKRTFTKVRDRAKLRSSIGLHSLRHTYASLLVHQKESPKYISRQMGHYSVAFTMDTYGHIFEETRTEAMERLNLRVPEPMNEEPERQELRVVAGGGA